MYIEYENKTEYYKDIVNYANFENNISKNQIEKMFAIEGSDFIKLLDCYKLNFIDTNVFKYLFDRIKVYARMKPEHKSQLVSSIRK